MLTEKDYCDYDTCVALKELGYNRGAYAYYFPNHKEDLILNTHTMRGCSINEMVKGYNTYPSDVMGHELIDAPTLWEAQKWLRKEKTIIVEANFNLMYKGQPRFSWRILYNLTQHKGAYYTLDSVYSKEDYDFYEAALSEGIKEAVKILKEK